MLFSGAGKCFQRGRQQSADMKTWDRSQPDRAQPIRQPRLAPPDRPIVAAHFTRLLAQATTGERPGGLRSRLGWSRHRRTDAPSPAPASGARREVRRQNFNIQIRPPNTSLGCVFGAPTGCEAPSRSAGRLDRAGCKLLTSGRDCHPASAPASSGLGGSNLMRPATGPKEFAELAANNNNSNGDGQLKPNLPPSLHLTSAGRGPGRRRKLPI